VPARSAHRLELLHEPHALQLGGVGRHARDRHVDRPRFPGGDLELQRDRIEGAEPIGELNDDVNRRGRSQWILDGAARPFGSAVVECDDRRHCSPRVRDDFGRLRRGGIGNRFGGGIGNRHGGGSSSDSGLIRRENLVGSRRPQEQRTKQRDEQQNGTGTNKKVALAMLRTGRCRGEIVRTIDGANSRRGLTVIGRSRIARFVRLGRRRDLHTA